LNKIARFRLDPLDRSDENFYEFKGDDSGVFGCMALLACNDVCPKNCRSQVKLPSFEENGFRGLKLFFLSHR
jgi:fumarate reductase iron-sulfur subunit